MPPEVLAICALLFILLGLAAYLWARFRWASAGLPRGRLVYGDTGKWERTEKPLYSRRHRLTGRPDYLMHTGKALIPVEIKSGAAPSQPYEGHVLQLAAYCLLVEEEFGARPPYGLLHYDNATLEIPNNAALRNHLLRTLDAMREASARGQSGRDHQIPQKCLRCGQRDNCEQRLA